MSAQSAPACELCREVQRLSSRGDRGSSNAPKMPLHCHVPVLLGRGRVRRCSLDPRRADIETFRSLFVAPPREYERYVQLACMCPRRTIQSDRKHVHTIYAGVGHPCRGTPLSEGWWNFKIRFVVEGAHVCGSEVPPQYCKMKPNARATG